MTSPLASGGNPSSPSDPAASSQLAPSIERVSSNTTAPTKTFASTAKGSYAKAANSSIDQAVPLSSRGQQQNKQAHNNTSVQQHGASMNHNKPNSAIAPVVPAPVSSQTPSGVNNGQAASAHQATAQPAGKASGSIRNSGPPTFVANGASVPPNKPSGTGHIQFGSIGTAAGRTSSSPSQNSHPTSSSADSLRVASPANPRIVSPSSSPSPIPQPPASGGRPPASFHGQSNSVSFGNFGGSETNYRSPSMSHSPLVTGPQANHLRRDSSHSQHSEISNHGMGPNPSGRGSFSQSGGRGRGYGSPYMQQANSSPGPGMRPSHNQTRNSSMNSFQSQQGRSYQAYPNSPNQAPRQPHSPMPHNGQPLHNQGAQMAMSPAHMGQPQYPGYSNQPYGYLPNMAPQQGGYPIGGAINPEFMHQWYHLYPQHPPHPGTSQSPRPNQYSSGPHAPYQGHYPQPTSMSRTSSTLSGTDRPASRTGKAALSAGQGHMAGSSQTPGGSGPRLEFQRPKKSTGIVIKDPTSGEVVNLKPTSSPAPSAKSSAPSAAPTPPLTNVPANDSDSSRARSESRAVPKTDGKDLREQLARQIKEKEDAESKVKGGKDEDPPITTTSTKEVKQQPTAEKEEATPTELKSSTSKSDNTADPFDDDELARWEAEEAEKEKVAAEKEAAYMLKKQAEKDEEARKEAESFKMADEDMKRAEKAAEEAEERKAKGETEAPAGSTEDGDTSTHGAGTTGTRTPAAEETPSSSGVATPNPEAVSMPPPEKKLASRGKASALKVETVKTSEPEGPSLPLQSLRSARHLTSLDIEYPGGNKGPLASLNPGVTNGKFRYDREFLLQFRTAFVEKPSEDWIEKLRETVLDIVDSQSARNTPRSGVPGSLLSGRQSSNKGLPMLGGQMGQMGSFIQSRTIPAGTTSEQRFNASTMSLKQGSQRPTMQNPLASYVQRTGGAFPQPGGQSLKMERTSSTTSLTHPNSPRNASQRGGSQRGTRGSRREDPKDNKSMPLTAGISIKPIEISATGWKPRSVGAAIAAGPAPGGDTHLAPDVVQRKVKSALNKMTPNNFDKIADSILEIAHQSKDESDGRSLRQVIQLTFEKATDEAHWAEMYAQFCKRMLESMSLEIKDENILDKKGDVVVGGALFRKYLLTRCQTEFERGWKADLPEKPDGTAIEEAVMLSDEYYTAAAAKRRGLGLVRFIGELYKLQMLTERIMHECVKKLVDYAGTPDEAEVESLTSLLKTIGAQLDASEKGHSMMDVYFQRISQMLDIDDLPSRLRFMLMDVFDLRTKYNWRPRNDSAIKGPTTLDAVRQQAADAERQKELQRAQDNQRRGGGSGGGRPPAGRGDARNFGSGPGGMPPPADFHRVGMDDLRRLSSKASSRQSSNAAGASGGPSAFGPTSMFASARGSNSRAGRTVNNFANSAGGSGDSNNSSRIGTPPSILSARKEKDKEEGKAGMNAFSVLANESTEATSPSTSPALSKVQPVNISEVASKEELREEESASGN